MKFIAAAIVALFALPMTASAQSSVSPTAAAKKHVSANARRYGLDSRDTLVSGGPVRTVSGMKVVRLDQERNGVPVIAGELVVTTDSDANVISVAGETSDARFGSTDPKLTESAATARALAAVAKHSNGTPSGLFSDGAELKYFDPQLLGGEALAISEAKLVWVVKVRSLIDSSLARDVMVDATTGTIGLQLPVRREVMNRKVCDANSTPDQLPCSTPARSEGESATGINDVDEAFKYLGDYHDFLDSHFGRDSLDGAGSPLVATVRYCEWEDDCPYSNAFWFEGQITLGEDYAVDDVIGHELTHGLNDSLFDPLYWFQTGAIDESISDIFGEIMDQTNATGTNDPGSRWLVGEETPDGALRDLADPAAFGNPDSTFSPNYYWVWDDYDPSDQDNGGVHYNSAVPSRAAALLVDGGSQNGYGVQAIGAHKTLRLFYAAALSKLSSGADFADLAEGLAASCDELVAAATDGFTNADCAAVDNAIGATGLKLDPPYAPAPEAPFCTTGAPTGNIVSDDAESPGGLMQVGDTNAWYRDEDLARSGQASYSRDNSDFETDDALTSSPINLPANAMLRFDHLYNFESDGAHYDGGVVEYSVAGGAWQDASGLPMINGYSGVIYSGGGNPLSFRSAFVAGSNGYRSTRVDFSSLAGKSIRVRFRYGSDSSISWSLGWSVDEIKFYTCPPPPPQPAPVAPPAPPVKQSVSKLKASVKKRSVKVTFSIKNAGTRAKVQCKLDGGGWKTCRSPKRYRGLKVGSHKVRVRVVSSRGTASASKSFRIRK